MRGFRWKNLRLGVLAPVLAVAVAGCTKVETTPLGTAALTSGGATNQAPLISGQPASTVAPGSAYLFRPSARDADGDSLTYSIQNKPSWAIFNTSSGMLTGVPASADQGVFANIVITVSDGMSFAALPAFTITVGSQAASAPTPTGSATLSWSAPTQNTDDTPLTDLAGYRVYAGPSAASLAIRQILSDPTVTRFTVDGLGSGTWYFAVTAVNSWGVESILSNIGNKTIP